MAKSNETFNKKEKEKKRLKKQQDKKERATERKANSSKGKSMEDMMAYLDENGNITDTPPVDIKRKPVSVEAISIATPKKVADTEDQLRIGVVSFFNTGKGYGFIRDEKTRENVFFHVNNINFQVQENDKVNFSVEKGPKGLNAVNITKL